MQVPSEVHLMTEAQPVSPPGWQTSELWTLVVFGVKNLVVLLIILGWLPAGDKEHVIELLTAFAGAAGMAVAEGAAVWKYIQSRQGVKEAELQYKQAALTMPYFSVTIPDNQQKNN